MPGACACIYVFRTEQSNLWDSCVLRFNLAGRHCTVLFLEESQELRRWRVIRHRAWALPVRLLEDLSMTTAGMSRHTPSLASTNKG